MAPNDSAIDPEKLSHEHMLSPLIQTLVLRYHSGYIPSEIYQPLEASTSDLLGYPGTQAAWELRKSYFQKSFRRMVDEEKVAAAKKSRLVDRGVG
jgi:hypothetical protein